jgi:hypothetical protein
MFKWIEKRRKAKQIEAQRAATAQLLTLAGFIVTRNYTGEDCHLCGEDMDLFYTPHTETSPHGEEITLKDKQGCACLRCGFVKKLQKGYLSLYEEPVSFDVFVNDYLEKQLQ